MKHQYISESKSKRLVQFFVDLIVDVLVKLFTNIKNVEIQNPNKIVFFSLGHLGDALILSYLFPIIKQAYPSVIIDVVTPDWSASILSNNPHVRKILIYNPWRQNRSKNSFLKKIFLQIKNSREVNREFKNQGYDISIEGRISHPNGNLISYRGGVRKRIGFGSGGFGSLLTNEVKFPEKSAFHLLEAITFELKTININTDFSKIIPIYYTNLNSISSSKIDYDYQNESFILINFETGNSSRELPVKFLLQMIGKVSDLFNNDLIISGKNKESEILYDLICKEFGQRKTKIINMVNKLSLDELFLLSKHAKLSLTLESLPSHLFSVNSNTISFYNNGSGALFFPISQKRSIVIHNDFNSKDFNSLPNLDNNYTSNFDTNLTLQILEDKLKNLLLSRI